MMDMESPSPMDRLLCGDVGYGKTEVAMRASFKAVMDGKQVAVLCPTTVLASQHHKTFQMRMLLFPVRVESLTRLQSPTRQKKILTDLKKGLVDIVIGTHRLLSKDVEFRDLGLLVVDEEQRFGVSHKEKIKTMRSNIDVLTMTATPIPRTLNLSLSGLRDISLIETAPKDRLAIHTVVTTFSSSLIVSAIKHELGRGGQVYFIHNKIDDIDTIAHMIEKWVPQAEVITVHGQMRSTDLESRMVDFIDKRFNVLVSTTIIENGIDIPLVNTLIVNRADRFGLAQLYQLRGRVGRSSRQALAYFLVPPFTDLTSVAKERLKALKEFTELGSGFRLAAKDLEIRGAGNFLGSEQHGYMEAVGFNYYMNLLEKTVSELKGEEQEDVKSEINMKMDMRIPESYLPQINLRLNLYKTISSVENLEDIQKIKEEINDRYGPLPLPVINLLRYGTIKFLAQKIRIQRIDRIGRRIIFKFLPSSRADVARMTRLFAKYTGSITPQGTMSLELTSDGETQLLDETISILKELSQV
jgi:transcription-repair coupling factor (superfamily II helicase)